MNAFLRWGTYCVAGAALLSCGDPLDGLTLRFKDPLTESTVQLQYVNANAADTSRIVPGLATRLAGPGVPDLVNLTGGEYLAPSREGLFGLAVDPDLTPTAAAPVLFSVVAQAPGFATRTTFVRVDDADNQEHTVRLFRFTNPPRSVSLAQETVPASGALTLQTPLVNGKQERATVVVPAGTQGLDAAGSPLREPWYLTLYHFDNRSGAAEAFTPGGYTVFGARDRQGQPVPAFRFRPAGFVSLEAATVSGTQAVAAVSQPLAVTVDLNRDTQLETGRLRLSDSISVWRFDESTRLWHQQAPVRVEQDAATGRWLARVPVDRVAFYALAEPQWVCDQGPAFTFRSDLREVDLTYLARLVDAQTGQVVQETWLNLNDGARRRFIGLARRTMRLLIYDYTNAYGGDNTTPFFRSEPFDNCTYREIAVHLDVPPPPPVTVEFQFVCPAGTQPNEAFLPALLHLQYRPAGTNEWLELARLSRTEQRATTFRLQMGKRYAFRGSPNPAAGWPFFQRDTTLMRPVYRFRFSGGEACR
jgi:hypothetical protein